MELLIILCVILALIVIVFARASYVQKKDHQRYVRRIRENYGTPIDLTKAKTPERYWHLGLYYEKHKDEYSVDDITWNDLEMDRVYQALNYSHSSCGEEYLYYRLRCPDQYKNQHALIEQEEETIAFLDSDEDTRVALEDAYTQIGYTGRFSLYQYLDFLSNLGQRDNLKHIIPNIFYLIGIGLIFWEAAVGVILLIMIMVYMFFTYLKEKSDNEPYLVSFSFILRLLSNAGNLNHILKGKAGSAELCALMKDKLDATRHLKRHPFFAKRNTGAGDPLSLITDYIKMITHYDLISFNRMLQDTRSHEKDIDEIYTVMGYLEYLLMVANVRASYECCVPEMKEKGFGIVTSKLYHPLIENAVSLDLEEKTPVLITGSNASGKSTFLREMGLSALLAQSVHTVFASSYQSEYFRIYSSMSLKDSLEAGDSYYMAEIRSLKRILEAMKLHPENRILCFVDEVLRGTNTVERVSASTQVLKYFADYDAMCFAATHDIELTGLLENFYHNYHFDEEVENNDISFSYMLKKGRATSRNAIKLLEIMGYEPEIVTKAQKISEHFLETGEWELVGE